MKSYSGKYLLNSAINNLPVDLHIHPVQSTWKPFAITDFRINQLDGACEMQDIFYSNEKDSSHSHEANEVFVGKA